MYKGIGASKGYGIGRAVIYKEADLKYEKKSGCDPKEQKERLEKGSRNILFPKRGFA